MATQNQIEANRRNSQKSTGPRTEQGKAVSRFNALKTGIYAQSHMIPGEDPSDLETLAAEYHAEFQPTTPTRRDLVDGLVCAQWELRRLRRVRAQLWHSQIADADKRVLSKLNHAAPLGDVFDRASTSFSLLGRRLDAAERSYHRLLRELQRPEPDPQPPEDTQDLASFPDLPTPPAADCCILPSIRRNTPCTEDSDSSGTCSPSVLSPLPPSSPPAAPPSLTSVTIR